MKAKKDIKICCDHIFMSIIKEDMFDISNLFKYIHYNISSVESQYFQEGGMLNEEKNVESMLFKRNK